VRERGGGEDRRDRIGAAVATRIWISLSLSLSGVFSKFEIHHSSFIREFDLDPARVVNSAADLP